MAAAATSPVFFYLIPDSRSANRVVDMPENALFRHAIPEKAVKNGGFAFGPNHKPRVQRHFVSIGSDYQTCDLVLPKGFPEKQCHFFIHPVTGELLLHDDSPNNGTSLSVGGADASKFKLPLDKPRQRVIPQSHDRITLTFARQLRFKLVWGTPHTAFEAIQNPRLVSRTVHGANRSRTFEKGQLVHHVIHTLGAGKTATVYKTIDLNTGDYLAVKVYDISTKAIEEKACRNVRKEQALMSRLAHPSIAMYVHAQGKGIKASDGDAPQLFMRVYRTTLKEETALWRSTKGDCVRPEWFPSLVKTLLQALSALDDCTVMHRDIQPANILIDDKQNFFLADFGSARVDDWVDIDATSEVKYMPPEAFQRSVKKTPKIDVWSFGVVLLETLGFLPRWPYQDPERVAKFRSGEDQEWFTLLRRCAKDHAPPLLRMLEMDVGKRLSARACLQRFFKGNCGLIEGLPVAVRSAAVPNATAGPSEPCPIITSSETGDLASAASTASQPMVSPFALVQRRQSVPTRSSAAIQPAEAESRLVPRLNMEGLRALERATELSVHEQSASNPIDTTNSGRTGLEAPREQIAARPQNSWFTGAIPAAWGDARPVTPPRGSSRANGRPHTPTGASRPHTPTGGSRPRTPTGGSRPRTPTGGSRPRTPTGGSRTPDLLHRSGTRDGWPSQVRGSKQAEHMGSSRRALQEAIETGQRSLMRDVSARKSRDARAARSSPQQVVSPNGRPTHGDAPKRRTRLDARTLHKASTNPGVYSSATMDEWIVDTVGKLPHRPELSRFENELRQRRDRHTQRRPGPLRNTAFVDPQYLSQVCQPEARLETGSVARRNFRSEPFQMFRSPRRSRHAQESRQGARPDRESPPSSPSLWKGCCMIS